MIIQKGIPKNLARQNLPRQTAANQQIHSVERIVRNIRNVKHAHAIAKNKMPKLQYRNRPVAAPAATTIHVPPEPLHVPYHVKPEPLNKKITLNVAQGLGDILWAYQKLSPYFEEINFNILTCGNDEVQHRCFEWMKIFPKTKSHQFLNTNIEHYHAVAQSTPNIKDVMQKWENNQLADYCPNRWLEMGTRIENIDPGSILERTIPLLSEPFKLPFDKYISIAISGGTDSPGNQSNPLLQVWTVEKWTEYIKRLYDKYSLNYPALVLGANFDKSVCDKISDALNKIGIKNEQMIAQHPLKVMYALQNANFMIGYQSGLNIVSENFDVPQIMLYFSYLKPMLYSWCKHDSIRTIFHANTFSKSPLQVITENDLTYALDVAANREVAVNRNIMPS